MKPLTAPNRPSFRPDSCVPPRHRGDQVDVALAQRAAFFGEGHAPGGALAFGKVLGLAGASAYCSPFEQRDHRVGRQRLHQVVAQAALVEPGLRLAGSSPLLVRQRHRHPGISTALLRSRCISSLARQLGASKYLGSGQTRTRCPACARRAGLAHHQRSITSPPQNTSAPPGLRATPSPPAASPARWSRSRPRRAGRPRSCRRRRRPCRTCRRRAAA
jgi:hypothetical protein